jgi:uncharacterized protein YbaP (TraB family)
MSLGSLTFSRLAWLGSLAALASAPAGAVPHGKDGASKAAPAPAARAEPRPALWLLADDDTRIYMFGTIHALPPGFRWRSAALDKAVGEAAELVVETYEVPDSEAKPDDLAGVEGFFGADKVPILKRVPRSKRKALKAAIAASGVPAPVFDKMHSWAAAMTLGIAQMMAEYGIDDPDQAPGVEDVLEAHFRGAGKPILSVEDGDKVLASMSALPEKVQTELLIEAIAPTAGEDGGAGEPGAIEADWVAGRSEALDLALEPGFPPAMFDVLVRRRNAAWTLWLEERLKKPGTLLFAVGAGHLAGRESVQAMLASRGLRVKRID